MVETARSAQEMQNVATHEIAHGMGMDSRLYWQTSDGTAYYGDVTTWDSLLTLNGEHIVTDTFDAYGNKVVLYDSLEALQAAAWEVPEGKDPYDNSSYTGDEIQYDPDRKLSLNGELGVHVSAVMLGGDTMEHLSYDDGLNVLGPGGRENGVFSENDLRALEREAGADSRTSHGHTHPADARRPGHAPPPHVKRNDTSLPQCSFPPGISYPRAGSSFI